MYKQCRNKVSRFIKDVKRDYFEKTTSENTNAYKVLWQNVKKLTILEGITKQYSQKVVSSNGDVLMEP